MSIGFAHAQTPYPPVFVDGSQPWTSGNINLSNVDNIIYYNSATQNSEVDLKASNEIVLTPGAVAGEYTGTGNFHASIQPEALGVVSFHPNGWLNIPRYNRFEMGIKLPASIQSQINAFLNGQTGINPYDPGQIQVECVFNSGAYKRYGFYYRDFNVQNNTWIEKSTPYAFRIRIAPEQIGSNMAVINVYVNGNLIESSTRYFDVVPSGNLGHLEMANGNLLKMQYNNGQIFFGIGQNVAYAIPDTSGGNCAAGPCNSPYTFQKQRDYLVDLAANGGNFTRVRMDALNMMVEWPYKKELISDPQPPNKPLSAYLNNYNDNQRYLWEFDRIFATLENTNIKSILCLLPDQNFAVDGAYDPHHLYTWNHNPYSTLTDTTIAGNKAFFSNPQSKAVYQNWLYYVMARYGYSTSMAMWQMINETANVASTNAVKHAIDYDLPFNTNVKNWVCDMKFYLQQMYPIHPATTGFVSPTNSKNIAYNCLNVWSSNSYGTYIDSASGTYRDDNFNARANAQLGSNSSNNAGYFPNYKPFFWGELGLADGVNIIDRKSDREFHNTIWATTFTGGISSGLYWNDWEQLKGVNHRQNFNALRNFIDMIDFSQRLEPGKSYDNGQVNSTLEEREIHTYWMKNGAKNYIVGWTKNNSANWTQDEANFDPVEWDTIAARSRFNKVVQEYTCFSTNQNPETVIDGLLGSTNYKIKIYNTYNNATEIEIKNASTSLNGRLTFRRDMYSYINDPFNSDYAFIIKPNSSWRMHNSSIIATDTIYATTIDTVTLNSRFVINKGLYKFNWELANNQIKHDSSIALNYPLEGTYSVNLEAIGLKNDTTVRHNFIIKVSDNEIKKRLTQISVYPNPANNFLYIYYDNETVKNPIITCVDVLGKAQDFQQVEPNKFSTMNLSDGLYFIKIKYSNYEKTFKINITH